MLTIKEKPEHLLITAAGKLTREYYETFVPEFEHVMRSHRRAPMLVDVTELKGWEIESLWMELKFDIRHQDDFGPMAVVGDETWQEWGTKFSAPFFTTEVRFFRPYEREDAVRWLERQRRQAA